MKVFRFFLFYLLLLLAQPLCAEELFTVLISQNSSLQKPVSNVSAGLILQATDKVIVYDNGYLGLIHKNGKTVEIRETGVYAIDSLSNTITNPFDTLTISTFVFYKRVTSKAYLDSLFKSKPWASTGDWRAEYRFRLLMGTRASVYPDDICLIWLPINNVKECDVKLLTQYEEIAYHKTTHTNSVSIDINEIDQTLIDENESSVKIVIYAVNNEELKTDDDYFLTFISPDELNKTSEVLNHLKQLNPEISAVNYLILGAYLEKQGLYLNAMDCFNKASIIEPYTKAYAESFTAFLKRNDLYISTNQPQER